MSERRSFNDAEHIGLLPHELAYVRRGLGAAAISKKAADEAYGKAVADSGGDWALDDPASQAAAQAARVEDVRVERQKSLTYLATMEYPSPESKAVEVGSRVTLTTPEWEDVYDIASRIIAGMPIDDGVELLSAHSPLGTAMLGKEVGDTVTWNVPNGKLSGQVSKLDQLAQRAFYEATLEAESR